MNLLIGENGQELIYELSSADAITKTMGAKLVDGANFYAILDYDGFNYLQVAGAQGSYTLEVRVTKNDKFIHWIIGHKIQSKTWTPIECSVGPIWVLNHEVLNYEAIDEFLKVYTKVGYLSLSIESELRERFNFRNITKQFTQTEV
jgi:hypothetical protein